MKITILFFGISSDLVGNSQLEISIENQTTVADFKNILKEEYGKLEKLNSYAIAVNEEYATDEFIIKENDIVAVIPPVSGG